MSMSSSFNSSSTRTPSFSLSLRALLTFPIRICNPPPAASSVRSCKVTPLIKVSLDDVLNRRHLPPLTLKDFEEWLVFVEGKPQYLYFLLWLKEYESRYATWLAEFGFSYYPTTTLSPPSASSSFKSSNNSINNVNSSSNSNNNRDQDHPDGFAVPTSANINYIPPSPSLALFFTRAKKTFFDPTASPPSPYTLPYHALLTLASPPISTHSFTPSIPQFNTASRPDLIDINEKWRLACKSLFGSDAHPHPHPKEFASLANHVRSVLKDSLERFAISACHNVGTRRAWCGLAGGMLIVLIMGVLPTLIALFYAHSRWIRLVGFWGCWLGGTVILSSLHGICMMIYLFGDLRQLRSFELAKPAISNPRAIARARPRLKSLFTRTGEEEENRPPSTEERKNIPAQGNTAPVKAGGGINEKNATAIANNDPANGCCNAELRHHVPSPMPMGTPPVVKVGLPISTKQEKAGNGNREGEEGTGPNSVSPPLNAFTPHRDHDQPVRSPVPLHQLSTIISTSEDATPATNPPAICVTNASPSSSVVDLEKEGKPLLGGVAGFPVHSSTSLRSDVTNPNSSADTDSDWSSSSDHGIVVSPAFETSAKHEQRDSWMWDSVRGRSEVDRAGGSTSSRSRVWSAVGSVVHWAATGITGKRVNSNTAGSPSGVSSSRYPVRSSSPRATTTQPKDTLSSANNNEKIHICIPNPDSSNSSALPTPTTMATINTLTEPSITTTTTSKRPVSDAGTFGVRSWIGGMMRVVDKTPGTQQSQSRRSSASTRYSRYQHHRFAASLMGTDSYADGVDRRMSRVTSGRWSRNGFGFGFGFGGRSVPEEGIYEEESEKTSSVSTAAQLRTCACPEEYFRHETTETESTTQTQTQAHSDSQVQTIASFYAPPRASILIPKTHNDAVVDQYTAGFIPRDYAAEVLPDLESVPRVSLSMSRASGEKENTDEEGGKEKDSGTSLSSAATARRGFGGSGSVLRRPLFEFEGLPELELEDVDEEVDEDGNKENIPLSPAVGSPIELARRVRPRPPRLDLHSSAPSKALAAASSSGTSPSTAAHNPPPMSPALPSSRFASSMTQTDTPHLNATTTAYLNQSPSAGTGIGLPLSPLPIPPPTVKSSKFWFDACPRHPAVEARIAEAQAQAQAQGNGNGHWQRTDGPLPPHSPISLVSTTAPSTFHSSPQALTGRLPATYPYPYILKSQTYGEGGRRRNWTSKVRDKIRKLAGTSTPSQANAAAPTSIISTTTTARPSSAQLSSNFMPADSDTSSDWRSRFKSVTSVPAFGPLTRVLSPVVSRGQWEIVVRSTAYAFLATWLWLGVMVSLPGGLHVRAGSHIVHQLPKGWGL